MDSNVRKHILKWGKTINERFEEIYRDPELVGEKMSFSLKVKNFSEQTMKEVICTAIGCYKTDELLQGFAAKNIYFKRITIGKIEDLFSYEDNILHLNVEFRYAYGMYTGNFDHIIEISEKEFERAEEVELHEYLS